MSTLAQLQTAFYEMLSVIEKHDGWIITVYGSDHDPRVHSASWEQDDDVIYMSDDLYALYCAHIGMKNENMKR